MKRVLMLYRPRLPGQRAQAIQVVHAAHALARRGHPVTLLADSSVPGATAARALASLGLPAVDRLHLHLAPVQHKGGAGLWFRARAAQWSLGAAGVVLCRDLERLVNLRHLWRRHRVVLEVHGLRSGRASGEARHVATERAALGLADALIANCEGTLDAWRTAHDGLLPEAVRVAHNGVAPHRMRGPRPSDGVVRVVGSLRTYKGWATLLDAAAHTGLPPIEVVGGSADELGCPIPSGVRVVPAVPYPVVPDLLARSRALVLPLADNRFGRTLTSPLKLFDYLATAVPLVLPQLPSVRRALASAGASPDAWHGYAPGDSASLHRAIQQACAAPPRRPVVRSWDDRLDGLTALLHPSDAEG